MVCPSQASSNDDLVMCCRGDLCGQGRAGHPPAQGHTSSKVVIPLHLSSIIFTTRWFPPRKKTIPKNAQTFEEIIIEAALKKTVEEHQKALKLKKDDIVSKDLSKDILLEAVKQSLSEETFQIQTSQYYLEF